MSLTQIQHKTATSIVSANTLPVTVVATVAGDLIVVGCLGSGSDTITSITDDKGSIYVQAPGARAVSTGGRFTDVWYCSSVIVGVTTITVHYGLTNTNRKEAYVHEVSGADPSSPFDAANIKTDTASGTTAVGAAVTTVGTNTYIIGLFRTNNTAGSTIGGGFTFDDNGSAGAAVHDIVSVQGIYTPTYSINPQGTDDAYSTVSFKGFSGVPPAPVINNIFVADDTFQWGGTDGMGD